MIIFGSIFGWIIHAVALYLFCSMLVALSVTSLVYGQFQKMDESLSYMILVIIGLFVLKGF